MNIKTTVLKLTLLVAVFTFISACTTNVHSQEEQITPTPMQTEYQRSTSTPALDIKVMTPTFTTLPTNILISTPMVFDNPVSLPADYVVKSGDTLEKISSIYGIPVAYIAKINHIDNVNLIYAGQILKIQPIINPTPNVPGGKHIIVELSTQKLFAYKDNVLIKKFDISSGLPKTQTVIGEFAIKSKFEVARMKGPGYDIPDVPWIMYFYGDYSLHGAYWHNNFGMPMSHGCVNLKVEDAKWLFYWAPLGTSVQVIN